MLRKLSAIEIAEGALLADIAVVFQLLLYTYLLGGHFSVCLSPHCSPYWYYGGVSTLLSWASVLQYSLLE